MAVIFDYNFDDGNTSEPLKKAWHFHQLQGPGPLYGDDLDAFNGYGFVYQGGSPLGESVPNDNLQTVTMYDRFPGAADYSAKLQVNFPVTSADRWFDLIARMVMTDDESYLGWSGYVARVRTHFGGGAEAVHLFRVVNGIYTELSASSPPVGVTIPGGIIDDHWGDYLKIRVSGERIWVYWNDLELISWVEDEADLIYGNYRVGFAAEEGQPAVGVKIRDLVVEDTSDEFGKTGRFILRVDDDWYGRDEMERLQISLQRLDIGYSQPTALSITVVEPHTEPIWKPEQYVELKAWLEETSEYKIVFRGKMRQRRRIGRVGEEHNEYYAVGPREQANYVVPEHPITSEDGIIWNALEDEEGYAADFSEKTVGEIITWYFDTFIEDLRQNGAVDPNPLTTPYVSSELSALDVKPTRIQIGGDFMSIMNSLLVLVPDTMIFVDPETWVWHFVNVRTLSSVDIDYTGDTIVTYNEFDDDTKDLFTAVWIKSSRVEEHEDEANTKDGSLTRFWNRDLEKDWKPSMIDRASAVYTVKTWTTTGPNGGTFVVEEAGNLYAWEWADCILRVISGRAGPRKTVFISGNSTNSISVSDENGIWGPSYTPQPGDKIRCEDARFNTEATAKNGFAYVHKRFRIADESKRDVVKHPCNSMEANRKIGTGQMQSTSAQPEYTNLPGSGIVEGPFQIVQFIPQKGQCDTSGQYEAADVTLNFRWKDVEVRKLRYPSLGFMGTAFSDDQSKWGSDGAYPAPDDWGLMREGIIRDDEWTEDDQDTGRQKAAEAWLRARMDKPFSGQAQLHGLDWQFRSLQLAVTWSTTAALRSGTTGLETAYILVNQVTYAFVDNKTALTIGDAGTSLRSYNDLLKVNSQTDEQALLARISKQIEEFKKCFDRNDKSKAGASGGGSTCSTSVRGGGGGGGGGGGAGNPPEENKPDPTDEEPPPDEGPPLGEAPGENANPTGGEGGSGDGETGTGNEDGNRDPAPENPDDNPSPSGEPVPGGPTDPNPKDIPQPGYDPGDQNLPGAGEDSMVPEGGPLSHQGTRDNNPLYKPLRYTVASGIGSGSGRTMPGLGGSFRADEFILVGPRLGHVPGEEYRELARFDGDPTRMASGRDKGGIETGRTEIPRATFHHKPQEDIQDTTPGNQDYSIRNTPVDQSVKVLLRDSTGGAVEALMLGQDFTVAGRVVHLNAAPPTGHISVQYDTQGDTVRRSETLQFEIGHAAETEHTLQFEVL